MKKAALSLLLLISTTLAFSQDNASYKSSLKKMIQVSGSEVAYKGIVNQMITMFKQQQSNVPAEFWNEFSAEMNRDAVGQLVEMLTPIYQKHLTESDIQSVISFYETPVGRKFAEKTPLITQESMQAGQEWGKQIGERVMEKLRTKGYLNK